MPRHGDLYVGRGGHMVLPVSESDAITAAIQHITHGDYREALDTLKHLRDQVSRGYHQNAPGIRIVRVLGRDVHQVKYQHAHDGKFYQHEFGGNVEVLAIVRNGKKELLLAHKRGLPLWDEF